MTAGLKFIRPSDKTKILGEGAKGSIIPPCSPRNGVALTFSTSRGIAEFEGVDTRQMIWGRSFDVRRAWPTPDARRALWLVR